MERKNIVFLSILMLMSSVGQSQDEDRCGTVPYQKQIEGANYENQIEQFEKWIKTKTKKRLSTLRVQDGSEEICYIPVVFHIVHNGEPIGQGGNVSDAQIYSQLRVLNDDFQRKNSDKNNLPDKFLPLASSMNIQFVLARQDPHQQATTGIVRVKGSKSAWSYNDDDAELKASSFWSSEDYLNIWVTKLTEYYIGYAQYPPIDYPGLTSNELDIVAIVRKLQRLTDGVVVDYGSFGSIDDDPNFKLSVKTNKGRTLTHEVGHYFGLRHVWGDDKNCNGNDYIDDTPPSKESYDGKCPNEPKLSCDSEDLYQNFLYYTNDACMCMFTKGQVERMRAVLENSPRRKSLLTSRGLAWPDGTVTTNEIAIVSEKIPRAVSCDVVYQPTVTVRNLGSLNIYNLIIETTVNGVSSTYNKNLSILPDGGQVSIELNPISLSSGNNFITIKVLQPPPIIENNLEDNTLSYTVSLNTQQDIIPTRELFNSTPPATWFSVENNPTAWEWKESTQEHSMVAPLYGQPNSKFVLYSQVLDFSGLMNASMTFDVSYGLRSFATDTLALYVSDDCGTTYHQTPLYAKSSQSLMTAKTELPWAPTTDADWRREHVILDDFVNSKQLRFAFLAKGTQGNNIYLDNIEFYVERNPPNIINPDWFTVINNTPPTITFKLEDRSDVDVRFISMLGQQLFETNLKNVLNQTYRIEPENLTPGIYIMQIKSETQHGVTRLYVGR